jgi:hypothetical protein
MVCRPGLVAHEAADDFALAAGALVPSPESPLIGSTLVRQADNVTTRVDALVGFHAVLHQTATWSPCDVIVEWSLTHSRPNLWCAIAGLRIGEPSPSPSRLTITANGLEPFTVKSPSNGATVS